MRKLGIHYVPFEGWNDEDFIKKASEVGFTSFFSAARTMERHVSRMPILEKYGMEYETIHAPFTHINDIWKDKEEGEDMYRELTASIDQCAEIKGKAVTVHLSSGKKIRDITEIGKTRFRRLVDYAIQKDVKIAFENLRSVANLAWALETFADTEMVGFCWDCGHESCFTPDREFMPMFGKQLICTHIHDNEGIYDKDSHLIPFDGNIDFKRVAKQIRESGFQGALSLEIFPWNSHNYDDVTPEEYLERAAAAIKRLANMVEDENYV